MNFKHKLLFIESVVLLILSMNCKITISIDHEHKSPEMGSEINVDLITQKREEISIESVNGNEEPNADQQLQKATRSKLSKSRDVNFKDGLARTVNIRESKPAQQNGDRCSHSMFSTLVGQLPTSLSYKGVTYNPGQISYRASAYACKFNDPNWHEQWQLQDYRTINMPVMDHNVVPVWNMGITGKGVKVAIVDCGIHRTADLGLNFDESNSYDYCDNKPGCDPGEYYHGTYCASVIAMTAGNGICGVGIAYNATVVGVVHLCDTGTTSDGTARALTHHLENIDIYSNSWGYPTDGHDILLQNELVRNAYIKGSEKGRKGKGSIYVHSAGNEKNKGSNCAIDCNINQPYVITIAAADQWGHTTYYSERCPAILATTYSRGYSTEGIVAAGPPSGCQSLFGGSSAACAEASAIIALTLEANPKLTYRDVMHLITMSAEVAPLADNRYSWYKNGRGFWVSNDFGFGLMNALNMVTLAKSWVTVPERRTCVVSVMLKELTFMYVNEPALIPFETNACEGTENEVNFLEHVELTSEAAYYRRGDINIYLTSASKTKSQLLETRYEDDTPIWSENWIIMTTHNWGENPRGKWVMEYRIDKHSSKKRTGWVKQFTITFHGTKDKPSHYTSSRIYAPFRLPDGKTSI